MRQPQEPTDDTEHASAYAVCHALTKRGRICRKPAIGIDYHGGWPVCQEHLDAYLKREENQD